MTGVEKGAILFFFQAEDGIRVRLVTGVQTCALPIFSIIFPLIYLLGMAYVLVPLRMGHKPWKMISVFKEIGRASCRERV